MKEIGCFISPHGYGHATRCIAVVEALQDRYPELIIQIITTVPESLFTESLRDFSYHPLEIDVGLVQSSALDADIPATIEKLDKLLPYEKTLVNETSTICKDCSLILSDIAPLGILAAKQLDIPSVLLESFTWDWIYQPYLPVYPSLHPHAEYFKKLFNSADYRIQTEPLCDKVTSDFYCGPIARSLRGTQKGIKEFLGCSKKEKKEERKIILVTMGGIAQEIPLNDLRNCDEYLYVFTGQHETRKVSDALFLLDRQANIYHPDLIDIADLVVAKAGYSTVAECSQAGARVLSVGRDNFAESGPLQNYLSTTLSATNIDAKTYESGRWVSLIPGLLRQPKPKPTINNADLVASFLSSIPE